MKGEQENRGKRANELDGKAWLRHSENTGKTPRQIIVAEWEKATCNLNRQTMIGGVGI